MPASPVNWSKLLISFAGAAGAACTVFLFFSYYKIIKRHCLAFHGAPFFFRRRTQMRLLGENNLDDPSLQIQSEGLASAVIHSLPAVKFREIREDDVSGNTDCAVCLGEFLRGEWLRLLPNCSHIFHVSCIDTWFRSHSNCPLCRTNVLYDFSNCDSSVSMVALLETLRREDMSQERPISYRLIELENLESRRGSMSSDPIESESNESFPAIVSSLGELLENQ